MTACKERAAALDTLARDLWKAGLPWPIAKDAARILTDEGPQPKKEDARVVEG